MINHLAVAAWWCFMNWPEIHRNPKLPRAKHKRLAAEEGECGGHLVRRVPGGGWRCQSCLLEAWGDQGLGRLSRRQCDGAAHDRAHSSHRLATTRGVLWCMRCAAHTRRVPRALLAPCRGRPRSIAYVNYLRRLRAGLMPTRKMQREEHDRGKPLGLICLPPAGHAAASDDPSSTSIHSLAVAAPARSTTSARGRDETTGEAMIRDVVLPGPRQSRDEKLQTDAVAAVGNVRRRISRKSPPDAGVFEAVRDARCALLMEGRWISRVVCSTAAAPSPCVACASPARSRCRGCARSLCLSCARAQRSCGGVRGNGG